MIPIYEADRLEDLPLFDRPPQAEEDVDAAVAAILADVRTRGDEALRVATKFGNIAKRYYAAQGRDIDIIQLNGSIELAPILGLSDVIVDIVETGTTLRENDLKVLTEVMPISARFIANRASYQFKHQEIEALLGRLKEVTEA